ncbi:MAG: GAF domain-containing protein [Calditrichaeota bacterium]|nr:MAG: GAF domain-containing protein [Calditrichota bacterium]
MKLIDDQIQHVQDVVSKFSQQNKNELLFYTFCENLKQGLRADSALFFLYDQSQGTTASYSLYPSGWASKPHSILKLNADSGVRKFIKSNNFTLLSREHLTFSPLSALIKLSGNAHSDYVLVQLMKGKKPLGFFLFGFTQNEQAQIDQLQEIWSDLQAIALDLLEDQWKENNIPWETVERNALLKLAQKLSSTLKLEHILKQMLQALLNVVKFDKAVVFLINAQTGEFDYEYAYGFDEDVIDKLHLKLDEGITGWTAQTGKAMIVSDVTKEKRYVEVNEHIKSEVSVPIRSGRKIIGVFTLSSILLNAFNQKQLRMLEAFASSASITLQNARLYEHMLQKRELEKDLQVAKKIQKALLQRRLPQSDKILLAAYNKPSKQVGGDLYNAINLMNGNIILSVGDIAGKGVSGAIIMATLQAIYRTEIRYSQEVNELLEDVNQQFADTIEVGRFATFFHSVIKIEERKIEYCSAGHNPAIVLHKNGKYELLEATGIILGLLKDAKYSKKVVAFEPGDVLVAYSDGVTEAENELEEQFGLNRLIEVLKSAQTMNPAGIKKHILGSLRHFSKNVIHMDDITIVIAKYKT